MDTLEFILQGVDAPSGTYLSWESPECAPGFTHIPLATTFELRDELASMLPDFIPGDDNNAPDSPQFGALYPGSRLPTLTPMDNTRLVRVAHSAMLNAEQEMTLMRKLSTTFLPEPLLTALMSATRTPDRRVLLVLNTPPSCGQIPWELLPTGRQTEEGDDERLLDLLDVVQMGPILARDASPLMQHRTWIDCSHEPGVYLIEPWDTAKSPGVLGQLGRRAWAARLAEKGDRMIAPSPDRGETADRIWLSSALRADPDATRDDNQRPLSHLLYVGHMSGDGQMSRLQLDDSPDTYGRMPSEGRYRLFSAADLVYGTVGWSSFVTQLIERFESDGIPLDVGTQWPSGISTVATSTTDMPFDEPMPVNGARLWPMPPRVGLIACQSGTELRQLEPFGMAAAILEAGAELVLATRWTMLTDSFFTIISRIDPRANEAPHPFLDLSLRADDLLTDDDPIHAMNEWKRECLRQWRTSPSVETSPITWAGLTAFRAPDRSTIDPQDYAARVDELIDQARQLVDDEEYSQALAVCDDVKNALGSAPASLRRADTLSLVAVANDALGRSDRAIRAYEAAARLYSQEGAIIDVATCTYSLAVIHEERDEAPHAIALYKRALEIYRTVADTDEDQADCTEALCRLQANSH